MTKLRGFTLVLFALAITAVVWIGRELWVDDRGDSGLSPRSSSKEQRSLLAEDSTLDGPEATRAPLDPAHAANPAKTFELRCLDHREQPIPGVELLLGSSVSARVLGLTGSRGELELPGLPRRDGLVTTVHPDFVTVGHEIRIEPGGVQALRLRRGASLSGEVVFADGSATFEDVHVLARPSDHLPTLAAVERARNGLPSPLHLAEPDGLGRFEIRGLDADSTYFITAAGPGSMARESRRGIAPGGEPVRLELGWLYGVRVRLVETGGAPLRTSRAVGGLRGVEAFLGDASLELAGHRLIEAVLAWIPPAEIQASSELEYPFLYLGWEKRASAGPLSISADIPGYAPRTQLVPLPRLLEHIPAELVECTPTSESWGALRIRFSGAPALKGLRPRPQLAPGRVVLLDSAGVQTKIRIDRLGPGAGETFDVPAGVYRLRFESGASDYAYPTDGSYLSLEHYEDETLVEIPLEQAGALRIDLFEAAGESYRGQALVRVGRPDSKAFRHVKFFGPPYVLQGMAEGEYSIGVITGATFSPPGREPFQGTVAIEEGVLTHLELSRVR